MEKCDICGEELTKELCKLSEEYSPLPCDCEKDKCMIRLRRDNTALRKRVKELEDFGLYMKLCKRVEEIQKEFNKMRSCLKFEKCSSKVIGYTFNKKEMDKFKDILKRYHKRR